MPLILAVEPDRRQAAKVAASVRSRLEADLVIEASAEEALPKLNGRVPDLVLTTALLAPKDDAALAEWLRELGTRVAWVQTLTIPVLGSVSQRQSLKKGGVLSAFRRGRHKDEPEGCDPAMFAEQMADYLARAAREREEMAELLEYEEASAAEPSTAAEPEPVSLPELDPVIAYEEPEPIVAAAPEPVIAYEEPEPIVAAAPEPVVEYEEPEPIVAAAPEPVVAYVEYEEPEPIVVAAPEPVIEYEEPEPIVAAAPEPVVEYEEPEPIVAAAPEPVIEHTEPVVPVAVEVPAELAAAFDPPEAPARIPEWVEILESLRRDVETLRAAERPKAPLEPLPPIVLPRSAPVVVRPAPLSMSVARPPAPSVEPVPAPAAEPAAVAAQEPPIRPRPRVRRRLPRGPIQDEWGLFDPEQCGFAALLAKLKEATREAADGNQEIE